MTHPNRLAAAIRVARRICLALLVFCPAARLLPAGQVETSQSAPPEPATPIRIGADFPVDGLDLWLRADDLKNLGNGRPVEQWPARPGSKAGPAVQANPDYRPRFVASVSELNGRPALFFDGDGDYLHLPNLTIGEDATAFFVVEDRKQTPGGSVWRSVLSGDDDSYRLDATKYSFSFLREDKPPQFMVSLYYADRRSHQIKSPILDAADGDFHIFTFRRHGKYHDAMTLAMDGVLVSSATAVEDPPGFPAAGYTIGQGGNVIKGRPDRFYRGHIAEILVYSRPLAQIERMQVEDYLSEKYDLPLKKDTPPSKGMQLWLRADALDRLDDGATVSQWLDWSGRGHDAAQTDSAKQPAFSRQSNTQTLSVRFDAGDILRMPPFKTSGKYSVALVKEFSGTASEDVPQSFLRAPAGESISESVLTSGGKFAFNSLNASCHYIEGTALDLAELALANPPREGHLIPDELMEVIVYDRALTESEQARLKRYLKLRYSPNTDPRFFYNGRLIYEDGYNDQPYIVKLKDGSWLMVITTSVDREGAADQHMVFSRSTDGGRTWSDIWDALEPIQRRRPSWGTLYATSFGRVYCFYNLSPEKGSKRRRVFYCFRYSEDGGRTWSDRFEMPVREIALCREYKRTSHWGIDPPEKIGDAVFWAFSWYAGPNQQGEGFIFRSDNLDTERDPSKLDFQMLPEGDRGICSDRVGELQQEHNLVGLSDGTLAMFFRTLKGYMGETISRDGGHTWTEPDFARYAPGGRRIKQTRACPRVWRTDDGRYLLWYHHNDGRRTRTRNKDRNPAWLSAGSEENGHIVWCEPEVLLHGHDFPHSAGMSYPSLVPRDGRYLIAATEKKEVRIFEIDPGLLKGLFSQRENRSTVTDGLIVEASGDALSPGVEIAQPKLPELLSGGFTIDLSLECEAFDPSRPLLSARNERGRGWAIFAEPDRSLRIVLGDGERRLFEWSTDAGLLEPGRAHRVAFIVDGRADLLIPVVDGRVCDGGKPRQFGWTWFPEKLIDVWNDSITVESSDSVKLKSLRIYDRALRVSEIVGNHRAPEEL